jgi:hypothetical protein
MYWLHSYNCEETITYKSIQNKHYVQSMRGAGRLKVLVPYCTLPWFFDAWSFVIINSDNMGRQPATCQLYAQRTPHQLIARFDI